MNTSDVDRRHFLQCGGVAALAATAGCLGFLDDESSDIPEYEQYLPTADEEVFFVYADFEGLEEFEDDGEDEPGDIGDIDEPLLTPISGVILLGFGVGFTLSPAGLGDLLEDGDDSELDSQADQVLLSNDVSIVVGDLDTAEIGEQLEAEPEDELFGAQYEESDEIGSYAVYTPIESDNAPMFAIHESELLAANEREQIETIIDAVDGDGRATEAFEEFEWLLDTAGDGLIAIGGYGPDGFGEENDTDEDETGAEGPLSEIDDPDGIVSSLSFDSEEIESVFAASFDELDDEERDEIEAEFQSDRADVSVEFENGRFTAEGTFEREVIDEEMTEEA